MQWYWIIAIAIGSILGLFVLYALIFGIGMFFYVCYPGKRIRSIQFLRDDEGSHKKRFLDGFDSTWAKEPFSFKGYDGHELHGIYIPNENESNKFVICTHGYTVNHIASVKYAGIFRSLGYNVIIYDDRGQGNNPREAITMGYRESKDLKCLIDYAYARFGDDIYLGLHGESMGASTSDFVLSTGAKIKFVVSDCGYADCGKFFTKGIGKLFHMPKIVVYVSDLIARIFLRFSFFEIRPDLALKSRPDVPICIFHGEDDDFVFTWNSDILYEAASGYKEIHKIKGAKHAQSIVVDKEKYRETVASFLDTISRIGI